MQKIWLLVAALLAMVAQPAFANEIGRVKNVTSEGVNIIRAGDRIQATSGLQLFEGDIVETTRSGRVGITFIDDTRIAVAPSSRMIISRYSFDRARRTGASEMNVERGKVGVDSGQLSSTGNMRFRAGSSTLGVAGTHFIIEVDA